MRSNVRRAGIGAAVLLALAGAARATWSIVAVNTRTKEVCVATATCLSSTNLRRELAVIRIGYGGGASQALLDSNAANRTVIWNGLGAGLSPAEILTQLSAIPLYQSRQFGIVNMDDAPVTFSGAFTAEANPGVAGVAGDIKYAIQGNILAGDDVVLYAEQAFLADPGDLGQKVMAAMEAARAWGGDGRCSCSQSQPTSCQPLPPPQPFLSALVGCFLIGRIGDTGASQCNSGTGCASGVLYCALNEFGQNPGIDPVVTLHAQYDAWRAALVGRPDQVHSSLAYDAEALVADRKTSARVDVRLRDIDGFPIAHGGATFTFTNISGAANVTTPSAVVDHGDGSYSWSFRASQGPGTDVWRVQVNDGAGVVTLQPFVTLRVDPIAPMHCGFDAISASEPASVPIVVHAGIPMRGRTYLVLASNAGTSPGLPFGGTTLPLNSSNLLTFTYSNANSPWLSNSFGKLDRIGRAEARFTPDPALLASLAGTRVEWSAIVFDPLGSLALPPAGFDVLP